MQNPQEGSPKEDPLSDKKTPPRMREERKVVTILSADLVGSTALGARLDPEEVKLIISEVMARAVRVIEELGGTVKDLAGDGVLALFGAPHAHEDDAERAVRAGLRIAQHVLAYGKEVSLAWGVESLAVRVGIHTGPVVLGPVGTGGRIEYAAFGDTVNTTARLQSAAAPGSVLVSAETRRLIEPLFVWGGPQSLTLKGKPEPVMAHEAKGEGRPSAVRRLVQTAQARFVGRDPELRAAAELVENLFAGSGSVLFLTGEPGIGKSRLLLELRDLFYRLNPASGRQSWLEGRCVSYGESLPYWPYREVLREWIGVGPHEPEVRTRLALRRHVHRLFPDRVMEIYPYLGAMLGLGLEPDAAARMAQLSPEALHYRTFEVVEALIERLAEAGPIVVAIEDLHWADTTSLELTERLLTLTERAAVMLGITERLERDHPSWRIKETAAREFPHRTREIALAPLASDAERKLLISLVGGDALPPEVERRVLAQAEGNPFFLEELVRALIDVGALVQVGDGWRFDRGVPLEIPQTVEKVILARLDRLIPSCRDVVAAASVLGRRFSRPLLEGISGGNGQLDDVMHELQRLDLLREERRWPTREYRFKHVLTQEAAYRTLLTEERTRLHRRAAEWLEAHYAGREGEALGLLAHHWLAATNEDKAIMYLLRAGDKARMEYALDEAIGHYAALLPLLERRGARREIALVLFKMALALHTALRFTEANAAYQRAFDYWSPPDPWHEPPTSSLRVAMNALPVDADPKSAIVWSTDIRLCMQLFDRLVEAWPERTIVPSLAERWEISDDGLRYTVWLREKLAWSDGTPLTAHDVEFGIKRVLDPRSPGASAAIYFVLENGRDYCLGRTEDAGQVGVRAVSDRAIEFRLEAPAPYFMSVLNRPDGGPQPRHAIERHGDQWTMPDRQVVSGPFRVAERTEDRLVLVRRDRYRGTRPGNVRQVVYERAGEPAAIEAYGQNALDLLIVHAPLAELPAGPARSEAHEGAVAYTVFLAFDHTTPPASNVDFRRALAHAIDREALRAVVPANMVLATGGLVPPALQGHTPEIAPRFAPDRAREFLGRSGVAGPVRIPLFAGSAWATILRSVVETWERVLGIQVNIHELAPQISRQLYTSGPWPPIVLTGWLPGYPDPEYYLRLLLHSESKTNAGGFAYAPFDELIERARRERTDRTRLEGFHEADRMAVGDMIALIPLFYGRSLALAKPWVKGWWEFGKSCSSFADLVVESATGSGSPPA